MIAIVDYDAGNLKSVEKALAYLGENCEITRDIEKIRSAEKVILPGVGAFGDCMKNLRATGLIPTIKQEISNGKKFLGICVGLQILFESSEESPDAEGLGIFQGHVQKIHADLKIPQIGWNALDIKNFDGVFKNSKQISYSMLNRKKFSRRN